MRPLNPSEIATVLELHPGRHRRDPHGVLKALATLAVQHKGQIWAANSPELRETLRAAAQEANS